MSGSRDEPKGVNLRLLGFIPIPVQLSDNSTVEFRYLSGADASFLTKLIAEERDARNFVASFLHHQISTPEMTYEEIEAWPEDDLRRAARSFAEAPVAGFGKNIPSNNDVYESFRVLAVQYQDEIRQSIRKTFSAFSTNYIEKMNPMLGSQQAISAIVRAASGYDVSKYDFSALTSGIVKIPALQNELPRLSQNIIPNVSGAIEAAAGLIAQASSQSMLDQITALSTSVASAMKATDAEMYRSLNLFKPIDLQSLIPKLPNFTETFRRLAKARDGAIALEQAGFGYTEELWEMQFLVELSAIDDQDRPLEVFSEIRAITESVGFETELQGLFTEPSLLSKRWPALQEGLEDHKRGRYFSSVSVLLPQVEGVINDILTLKGSVIQQGKRFYARNADGLIGKELKGLQDKSALAKGAAQINEAMAKIVTSFIVPQRNGILHGVDVGYGTANLSTHLMVILLSLALGCAALEDELDHSVDLVPLLDGITEANLHGEIPTGDAVGREVW